MSSDALAAATAVGRDLSAAAVWYDGRCSWMGATSGAAGAHRALGPTLYKGTAGVGLFLAHLAAVTGDAEARRTALGALRHALTGAARLTGADGAGFHVGALGVAWAAAEAARVVDAPELHAGARELAAAAAPPAGARGAAVSAKRASPDVLAGTAGTIVGLLRLGDERLLESAAVAGESLLDSAVAARGGWSWATPERGSRRHLYGLAHGASGIAWALLELHAATGDARFAGAAERGFAYERSWRDERSGRWAPERKHGSPLASTGSWCHGEAGIALTHARAGALLGSDGHRRDAGLARAQTRDWLAAELRDGVRDLSLCHGATGAAEALPDDEPLRAALAAHVLERPPEAWPGGVPGITPALFRGTSGIAWWLLRVHDAKIPSPLGLTAHAPSA